jgi:[ribosomal protein S18]-alanine N-acetyltransferase
VAVLKKIRSRLWSSEESTRTEENRPVLTSLRVGHYEIKPLTLRQLEEVWRLDQRCFCDGEAYSRDTFEYLLTAPEAIAYRSVTPAGLMVGFIIGLVEPDFTGHVTTLGVAPEHRRQQLARHMMLRVEDSFRRRMVRIVRLEVRSTNRHAQKLYQNLGYVATQTLPYYYSNGGDGLLMIKSIESKPNKF